MTLSFRAAGAVALFSCTAAFGGMGFESMGSAQTFRPDALIEALPAIEPAKRSADDGIAEVAPEPATPADQPAAVKPAEPPRSLAQLVAMHASAQAAERELNCLATTVYYESKGEPLAGQLAVARVVLNRAKSGRFARTVCGVVTQPSQFSFVRRGVIPTPANNAQWREAVGVAKVALADLHQGPAANALFFHATRVSPNWKKTRVARVGNHVFYR